ncbi:MAG: hypothetical protein QM758_07730 [Armatimonas sp.]
MTVAVCLNCGEFKHGAFTVCPHCGYVPEDDESLTKHLIVTDHYFDRQKLEGISARVKAGEPLEFAPETLQAAWVSKAELDRDGRRLNLGCMAIITVLLLLFVGLLVLVYRH